MGLPLPRLLCPGSNKGIGLEIARRLAHDERFSVILCSRNLAAGQAAAASIGGRVTAMQLDIESEERCVVLTPASATAAATVDVDAQREILRCCHATQHMGAC
jgi:NAD(P)-dependent dehydrogenase (short-subunit alcohol dehydrogenase family)